MGSGWGWRWEESVGQGTTGDMAGMRSKACRRLEQDWSEVPSGLLGHGMR